VVWPSSSGGGSSSSRFTVSVDSGKNGSVTVSPKRAEKGDTVTITVKPNEGYELDKLVVTDKNGDSIRLTDKGNDKYTFTMPSGKVTVEATFTRVEQEDETISFIDVSASAYYYDAVMWAVEKGITSGTSATTFAPDATVTRGQTVTFLYRANNSPAVTGANPFTDVAADAFCNAAVQWAAQEGITSGTSATTFEPGSACTRAQIVTFMFRDMVK